MPQFELGNALPQVAWLILIFTLLYLALAALLPGVTKVAAERASVIGDDLGAAERARADARAAADALDARMTAARAAAAKEAAEAKAAASRSAETRLKAVDAELGARLAEGQARVDAARAQAVASLDTLAGEATAAILERLLRLRLTPERVQRAVSDARGAA